MGQARRGAIEAIIFDYGGVLSTTPFEGIGEFERANGYPKGSVARLLFGGGREVAGDPDQSVYDAPADPDAVPDWHLLETGRLALAEFHDRLVARSATILGAPVDGDFYPRFLRSLRVGVHWPVVHRVRELKADGYRTAILTNNIREWGPVWKATIPMDLFDVVVDSCDVGLRKPDPAIFELTCDRLGVAPGQAVFLDDSPAHVAAARAAGLHGIVVSGPDQALADLDALLARD